MDDKYKLIIDSFGKDRFKFNESLKNHTALGVVGIVKLFFIAFTISELVKLIEMCRQLKLSFFIFGTGSKIMITDEGFEGLVIQNRTKNINTISIKGKASKFGIGIEEALVEVDSGVSMPKFSEYLNSHGLSAGEISHIPGSLGGNLFINGILQSKTKSIKVLNLDSEVEEVEVKELSLRKHIILSAVLKFKAK